MKQDNDTEMHTHQDFENQDNQKYNSGKIIINIIIIIFLENCWWRKKDDEKQMDIDIDQNSSKSSSRSPISLSPWLNSINWDPQQSMDNYMKTNNIYLGVVATIVFDNDDTISPACIAHIPYKATVFQCF